MQPEDGGVPALLLEPGHGPDAGPDAVPLGSVRQGRGARGGQGTSSSRVGLAGSVPRQRPWPASPPPLGDSKGPPQPQHPPTAGTCEQLRISLTQRPSLRLEKSRFKAVFLKV